MKYLIDAWLDSPQPCLRVIDCHTGETKLQWQGARLQRRLDAGELALEDLCSNDPCELARLVGDLLQLESGPMAENCISCRRCNRRSAPRPDQTAETGVFKTAVQQGADGARVLQFPDLRK